MPKFDIFLSPPYIKGNEQKYVKEAFDTNWIAPLGPNVTCFENEMSSYIGTPYSVALSAGTAGIHLALKYLGVDKGDIAFCSDFTFSASCNPIVYQGATPVFIDSEPNTWNMSPVALRKAFEWAKENNKMPKAVVVVDLYGQSADWDNLLPICNEYNVPVLEDAAEAVGSTYMNKKCGSFGDLGVISFNGNKIITTSGGGMVLCNSLKEKEKLTFWATQSREKELYYQHKEIGYNYRLSNVCAAIGRGQLEVLPKKLEKRRQIHNIYEQNFLNTSVNLMPTFDKGKPNYWLNVITLGKDSSVKPTDIVSRMNDLKIETRPAWKPMHMQPYYEDCMCFTHNENESFCEKIFCKAVCLPSGDALTVEQQNKITEYIINML